MKLKHIEISLQNVDGFVNPVASLEQYMTPPSLAARFLFDIYMHHDLEGYHILDLGCGTGMLSIGAALLGAEEVVGVDCDKDALECARNNAVKCGANVQFRQVLIPEVFDRFDTVIMNPPFGAQNEHADRPFIETALSCAPVVWGIFNKGSLPFITAFTKGKAEITDRISAKLTIPRQFVFHTRNMVEIPVEIVRMETV